MVQERDTSIDTINQIISFMYGSLTDMDTLVRTTTATTGVSDEDHPIRDLKALVVKISRNLRESQIKSSDIPIPPISIGPYGRERIFKN